MHLLTQESLCWLEEGLFFLYAAEASEAKEKPCTALQPSDSIYQRECPEASETFGARITENSFNCWVQ